MMIEDLYFYIDFIILYLACYIQNIVTKFFLIFSFTLLLTLPYAFMAKALGPASLSSTSYLKSSCYKRFLDKNYKYSQAMKDARPSYKKQPANVSTPSHNKSHKKSF
jgi:hypothetical protein